MKSRICKDKLRHVYLIIIHEIVKKSSDRFYHQWDLFPCVCRKKFSKYSLISVPTSALRDLSVVFFWPSNLQYTVVNHNLAE